MNNGIVKPDIRLVEASEFMRLHGLTVVHKTPRAGMTVSSIIEAAKDGKVLVVVPFNKIAEDTVYRDVVEVSGGTVSVCLVRGNKYCVYNQEDIKEHPLLDMLPSMPLYDKCMSFKDNDGDKCNLEDCVIECPKYDECSLMRIFKDQSINVVVITYPKLNALISASAYHTGTAYAILQELMKCKTIIFDESHTLELDEESSIELYSTDSGYANVYSPTVDLSDKPVLSELLEVNRTLYSSRKVREELDIVVEELTSRSWNDKLERHVITNPLLSYAGADNAKKTERYIELTRELMAAGRVLAVSDMGLYSYLLRAFDVLAVCSSPYLYLTIKSHDGVYSVHVSATDSSLRENMQRFISWLLADDCREINAEHNLIFDTGKADLLYSPSARVPGMLESVTLNETVSQRRIILTTATHGGIDKKFLTGKLADYTSVTFGAGGDPLATNRKFYILADTYGLSAIGRNSRYNKLDDYFNYCLEIFKVFGVEACMVVSFNKKQRSSLKEMFENAGYTDVDLTYYNAVDTVGVSSPKRIMIALGKADKPATAYNVHAGSSEESKQIRLMRTHQDTWQAWNRVKDPWGLNPSIVFAFGVPHWECVNIATWGEGREVVLAEDGKYRYSVNVDESVKISMPNIIKTTGFNDMLSKGFAIMKPSGVTVEASETVNSYTDIPYTAKVIASPVELLKAVTSRTDVTAQQEHLQKWYKPKPNIFNDNFLKFHLMHEITLGTYALDLKDTTVFGVIDIDAHKPEEEDIAELKAGALDKYLFDTGINAIKEKTDKHSYHYWFLFERCSGGAAVNFLRGITEAIGFPELEVFPPNPVRGEKGKGNLVRYPLGIHQEKRTKSSVLVNGEYVRDFVDLPVRVYDISAFEPVGDKVAPVVSTHVAVAKPLRRAENGSGKKDAKYCSQVAYAGGSHNESFIRPCMAVTADTDLYKSRCRDWISSTVDEYLTAGYTEEEVLIVVADQPGFKKTKTKAEIKKICKEHKKCASCDKVRKWAGSVDIGCARCTHYRKWVNKEEMSEQRRANKTPSNYSSSSPLCPVSVAD